MTYRPGTLAAESEQTIKDDLESGEMTPEDAALCLMDIYGWLYRDARDQVEDWQARRVT